MIGKGFVGEALFEGMKHAFEPIVYDKKRADVVEGFNSDGIYQMKTSPDRGIQDVCRHVGEGVVFVCVPTPMDSDGRCNTSIVESVVAEIAKYALDGTVVCIKSTVVPGTTDRINSEYEQIHVCYNPEFLTERTHIEDFKNQDRIILGGPHVGTKVLKQIYETAYPDVPVTKTHSTIAELVKYMTNCFLATKVSFSNEMRQICECLEVDYDKVVEYATKDKRLGLSHWATPGPDGRCGFGGSCFPKDLNALMSLARELGVEANTMQGAWNTNLTVRPEKDWENLKGRAVSE